MSESDAIVILDVGGCSFRAKKSTLCSSEGYFRKLISETWSEQSETSAGKSLFIDRDPHCFPSILSYLRSGKIYLTDEVSSVYLSQLHDEAEYYMLDNLMESIQQELKDREAKMKEDEEKEKMDTATEHPEIYKAVAPDEVEDFFKRGYAYVGSYELPESASCTANVNARPTETSFGNQVCTACGSSMSYDKWLKHIQPMKHTRVVVKRAKRDEDRFKLAQSPFRIPLSTSGGRRPSQVPAANPNPGIAGTIPVSPEPDRSRGIGNVGPLFSPGNFNLDQSF